MGKKKGGNAGGDNKNNGGNNNNNNSNNNNGGNNNNNDDGDNNNSDNKNDGNGGGGGDYLNIVMKVDLHCSGCTKRIRKSLLSFSGVQLVNFEGETTVKIIAKKNVDAVKVTEHLEKKMSRKVEQISPKPPKKDDQKKDNNKQVDDKKPKELPLTTVILKIQYHCKGCAEKTYKAVSSYKGVYEVTFDKEKDLVTVKGKVDGKQMVESIKKKLKKPVEIVPEKKKDKKDGDGEKKQENNNGGGGKGGEKVSKNDYYSMVPYHGDVYEYGYVHGYGYGPIGMCHALPEVFSDENPNACSIM